MRRIKTRIKQLEKANESLLSQENEIEVGFRVLECGKRTEPFQFTRKGSAYANFLAFFNILHLYEMGLIDSLNDVCGKDVLAPAKEAGLFQNSSGDWEIRPDIEYESIRQFLEEDHKKLGNDLEWIKSLREKLESLKNQK